MYTKHVYRRRWGEGGGERQTRQRGGETERQTRQRGTWRDRGRPDREAPGLYFNHPSQGNSTNYYLFLGLRDKAAPPTSQQINKFPPKRVKNLATPSSILIFVFSSSTGELCSQPIRGNDRPIGRMFPEHVERSFLTPNIASTNTSS